MPNHSPGLKYHKIAPYPIWVKKAQHIFVNDCNLLTNI